MPLRKDVRHLLQKSHTQNRAGTKKAARRSRWRPMVELLEYRALPSVTLFGLPNWTELGPKPMINETGSDPNGPASGAIETVAVDPSNVAHMFIAPVNGGIWRTQNGNLPFNGVDDDGDAVIDNPQEQPTWTPLTDQFRSLAIGDIAFSPLDATGNTVFAGTGSASSLSRSGGLPIGVMRTTDNGNTWQVFRINPLGAEPSVRVIVPTTFDGDPVTPGVQQVVLVGTTSFTGLYRSTDGGQTYNPISNNGTSNLPGGAVTALIVDPNNASNYYAGVVGQGVYFSNDGGANWVPVNGTGANVLTSVGTTTNIKVRAFPGNVGGNTVLYAELSDANPRVFTSNDGGTNWTPLAALPATFTSGFNGLYTGMASDQLVVDPNNSTIVYVSKGYGGAADGFVLRYNPAAGGSWVDISSASGGTSPHVDNRDLIVVQSAGAEVLLDTNDGGIYFLHDPQNAGANRWTGLHGLGATAVGDVEINNVAWDSTFGVALAGEQDNGSSVQTAAGNAAGLVWRAFDINDGGGVQVDTVNAGAGRTFRYATSQVFFLNRHTFDSPTNEPVAAVNLVPVGGLAGFKAPFTPEYKLDAVNPGRLAIGGSGTGATPQPVYELLNAATAANSGAANWQAVPVGPGFGSMNGRAIAYGGTLNGIANPEVLVVGSGGQVFVRSTAGGTLTATIAPFPGGSPVDIRLDPANWMHFFVTDGTGVYETVDAGATVAGWHNLSGNLATVNNRLQSIEFIPSGVGQPPGGTLLVGGNLGVSRLILGVPGSPWTRLGLNLPNALVFDLNYNATSNVLIAGELGRGAWEIANASVVVQQPGALLVCGDEQFTNQNDVFRIDRNALNPQLLEVYVNGVLEFTGPLAAVQKIAIYGGGGNNTLIVDSSNGLISVPQGIDWNAADPCPGSTTAGQDGFNQTILTQTAGPNAPTLATDTYSVGPNAGDGKSVVVDTSAPPNTQTINFFEVSPTFDNLPAPVLTVNATNAGNAINYTTGKNSFANFSANPPVLDPTWGEVSVDNQEPIEFTNKTNLTINGLAGSDTINLNNPNTPTGLTSISVDGGDPTAGSDTLIANGTTVADAINFKPTGPDAGSITAAGPVPITFTTIEQVVINGLGGGDTLTYTSPANAGAGSALLFKPGATPDAGSITGNQLPGGALVPFRFLNLGTAGTVVFATANPGGGARTDTLDIDGTAHSDIFTLTAAAGGTVQIKSAAPPNNFTTVPLQTPAVKNLGLHGLQGSDLFNLAGLLPYTNTVVDGGDPIVNLTGATGLVTINLADSKVPTNTTILGYGGTVTLIGVDVANMDANSNAMTVNGTVHDDVITYTPTGASAGTFSLAGLNTTFNFTTVTGTFQINGGVGAVGTVGNTDEVIVQGTHSRDLFQIDQGARTVSVSAFNVNLLKAVLLGPTIQVLSALGLLGADTFQIIPAVGVPAFTGQAAPLIDNLIVNVDGSATSASDALVVGSAFVAPGAGAMPALPAADFVVVNRNATPNSGTVRVFNGGVTQFPDINYTNVATVSPQVAGTSLNPNLLVMGPDVNEPNNNQGNATFVGSGATLRIQNATIFPNGAENPGVPADQDYYRVVAQTTGTLDFQVYFKLYPGLLPQGGNLALEVLDAAGNILGKTATPAVFGTVGATANARVRIPAVGGQSYYLHVFGSNANGTPNQLVVNGYNATIVDTPLPLPANLELSRSVPAGVAGTPDTGDLPATAPGDDTGRSQFDNVTRINRPHIFVRLDDASLLQDIPGNQTPGGVPPMTPIPIPFIVNTTPADLAAQGTLAAGFRLALYDGGNGAPAAGSPHTLDPMDSTFIGFAQQVPGVPHLYELLIGSQGADSLADGLHNITARVQIIDPANPTQTGFGDRSQALQITVDTVPPPVSFGTLSNPGDGLDPASDTGVLGHPETFADRITSDTSPTFVGMAEANAIVRVFATGNGGAMVFLGETVAVPLDGTNAFPNGQWRLQTTVDLNNPALFPKDGLRHITATAEDLAGNVSTAAAFDMFIDTSGPQISNVQITGSPGFNLFGLKPNNLPQGPTPLVNSLTISVQDLPARVAGFLYNAFEASNATTPGAILIKGDNTGLIAIQSIVANLNPPAAGQPATGTIVLNFATPLPDDRYTLTIGDTAVIDPAGNKLDGESNASEPLNVPLFPSGDGNPGGKFAARFTVNSRPHIGTYCCGTQYIDINGNGVFDPVNKDNDQVNKDLVFKFGLSSDADFAGNFAPTGGTANGFSKLAAYGQVNGVYRFLIDTNGTGVPTINVVSGKQINGLPVAGKFNAGLSGDQIGLFDGHGTWYLDTAGHNNIDGSATVVHDGLTGFPIVGDFDGSGSIDLATYRPDLNTFFFDLNPLGGGPHVFTTIHFGFVGVQERPVAADMNRDGVTDIGLYVPNRNGISSDTAEWFFLVSNGVAVPGTVDTLNHPFDPTPLGSDLFFKFGGPLALPLVGTFDPPAMTGSAIATDAAGNPLTGGNGLMTPALPGSTSGTPPQRPHHGHRHHGPHHVVHHGRKHAGHRQAEARQASGAAAMNNPLSQAELDAINAVFHDHGTKKHRS